jgi:peptide deformylase
MISYIDASYNGDAEKLGIRPGVAIAANQMGLNKQIIYVHADSEGVEHKLLLANPKIISYSQGYSYLPGGEGCLSVLKEHRGIVKRRAKIIVEAKDLLNDNKSVKIIAEGLLSIILQHEIDHLSGILFYDRINKENPDYIDND